MASTITRRPLPALIALLALLLLTALVWWRVTNRDDSTSSATAKTCTSPTSSAAGPRTLPPPKSVDVLVLNATKRNGIAGKARKTLMSDGFRSSLPAADDAATAKVTGVGQIRYSADNRSGALLLKYYFPGTQLVQSPTASAQVTVSLGPTYTAVQSPKAVAARLAADKVTLTTATPAPAASSSSSC